MLEFVQDLCRDVTTSQCNLPRWSQWSLVHPSQSNVSIDVADVASGGGGAAVPANIQAYGSSFLTGLYGSDQCSCVRGYGAGAGAGAGWGIPFVGKSAMGRFTGIKRMVIEKLGEAAQGALIDKLVSAVDYGASDGTRLVCGPNAPSGELQAMDFQGFATIVALGANAPAAGLTGGIVFFSKDRPVIQKEDLLYTTAVGLIGGYGLSTSLDIEISGIVYAVTLGP